jgi:hypothetical protein
MASPGAQCLNCRRPPRSVTLEEFEMPSGKILIAFTVCILALLKPFGTSSFAEDVTVCQEPETGTEQVPMLSPPLASVVIGAGRLPFYSAPKIHCRLNGVFVVPKDVLITYARTGDGWSSVMYMGKGDAVNGWVRSSRLKLTGTVGPNQ